MKETSSFWVREADLEISTISTFLYTHEVSQEVCVEWGEQKVTRTTLWHTNI